MRRGVRVISDLEFINFIYDITYIGLHVYSLYHNVMYPLVYNSL